MVQTLKFAPFSDFKERGGKMQNRQYLCIDLKSFYASVECVERGLDPMETKLIVADPERCETTVCLAVTPALKKLGVKNRCRVYEIPKHIEYIKATPRMRLYIDYSAEIYAVYLKYVSKDDIYVYSIDEVFIDVTDYLSMYKMTARELGERIRRDVLKTTGIPAACGIGTNLFLAKVALDITAKKSSEFIGELDEESFKQQLWKHTPITDFWRIGKGTAERLAKHNIYTMGKLAKTSPELLKSLFGVDYDILLDHANGIEPTTIAEIKAYKSQSHSLSSGQVLSRDYNFSEGLTIVKEMTDNLCLELFDNALVTKSITMSLVYSGIERAETRGTFRLNNLTDSADALISAAASLYEKIMDRRRTIRKVTIVFNDVVEETFCQYDLFEDTTALLKERKKMEAVSNIKKKFGKNAILRGLDLKKEATMRDRNRQIGGHKGGKGMEEEKKDGKK